MKKLNILILEDEERAGQKLIGYIKNTNYEVEISWRRSIIEGREYIKKNEDIDLIFSDIELLDGLSFEIYSAVETSCPIIFCTAYDSYYMDAFDTNGISYLLKPYTEEQFKTAWKKYISLFQKNETPIMGDQLIGQLKSIIRSENKKYKQTFTVKKRDGIFLLKTKDIVYFQAQGDFVIAFDNSGAKHIVNSSLGEALDLLNPDHFFQINRSELIHKEFIEKYEAYTKSRLCISAKGINEKLYTSNSRSSEFKKWIES